VHPRKISGALDEILARISQLPRQGRAFKRDIPGAYQALLGANVKYFLLILESVLVFHLVSPSPSPAAFAEPNTPVPNAGALVMPRQ